MILGIIIFVHVLVSLFLIGVVLLQQGKGADLSVFGGGGTMTAFGARGAATMLHKLTVMSFVVFIVTTMTIGLMQGGNDEASVMSGVVATEADEAVADDATAEETAPAAAAPTDDGEAGSTEDGDATDATGATEPPAATEATDTPATDANAGT